MNSTEQTGTNSPDRERDRRLEDEHAHGAMFGDVVDAFLRLVPLGERDGVTKKWLALMPGFQSVHVTDVDDRLLRLAQKHHAKTFVNDVLRFARLHNRTGAGERVGRNGTTAASLKNGLQFAEWINDRIKPDFMVTMPMPLRAAHAPEWYLKRMLRHCEKALYGKRSLNQRHTKRPVWFVATETFRAPRRGRTHAPISNMTPAGASRAEHFPHVHILGKLPERLLKLEKRIGRRLPDAMRARRVRKGLIAASRRWWEPFAAANLPSSRRRADVTVELYRSEAAPYVFKQLRTRLSDHWTETLDGNVLRDFRLMILPPPVKRRKKSLPNAVRTSVPLVTEPPTATPPTLTFDGIEYEIVWNGSRDWRNHPRSWRHDDELLPPRPNGCRSIERFALSFADLKRAELAERSKNFAAHNHKPREVPVWKTVTNLLKCRSRSASGSPKATSAAWSNSPRPDTER